MNITNNLRATLNEGITSNQGRDFSDLGVGNIQNTQGFIDDTVHLALVIAGNSFTLEKGYCFVRYKKNNQRGFMKCELTQSYSSSNRTGVEYVYVRLDNNVLVTGSNQISGGDYFSITFATTLPSGSNDYICPLYMIDWDASGGVAITDLREKRDAVFRDVVVRSMSSDTITTNTITANSVILPGGTIQQQLTTLTNSLASGGDFVNVVLGEDINAGDKKGAVFYGKGVTSTAIRSLTDGGQDMRLGDADTTVKRCITFLTSNNPIQDILRCIRIKMKKSGNPGGNVIIKLLQADKVTPVTGFTPIKMQASTLPSNYHTADLYMQLDMQDVVLTTSTIYCLEFSRDVAFDSNNYIIIDSASSNSVGGFGTGSYQSSNNTWTDSVNDPFIVLEYGHHYEVGKVYASDPDYEGTNQCDGILMQSGLVGETRPMQIRGQKTDGVYPGLNYFISKNKDSLEQGYKNISDRGLILDRKQSGRPNTTIPIHDNRYYISFTPTSDLSLTGVSFYVDHSSTSNGSSVGYNVQLHPDVGGLPDPGVILADNTGFIPASVTPEQDVLVTNAITYSLVAGTTYWLGWYGVVGSNNVGSIKLRGTYSTSSFNNFAYIQGGSGNPAVNLTLDSTRSIHFRMHFVEDEAIAIDKTQGIISSPSNEKGLYSVLQPMTGNPRHIGIGDTTNAMRVLIEEANSDYGYTGIRYEMDDLGINLSIGNNDEIEKTIYTTAHYLFNLEYTLTKGGSTLASTVLEIAYSQDNEQYTVIYNDTGPAVGTSSTKTRSLLLKKGYYKFSLRTGNSSSASLGSGGLTTKIGKL